MDPLATNPFPVTDTFHFSFSLQDIWNYWFPILFTDAKHVFGYAVGLSFPLSLFFFICIIYCVEQLKKIRQREAAIYDVKIEQGYDTADQGDPALANRWSDVVKHVDSPNQNDWRQAILEADIILDEILTKMGYQGESIGEKLKRANKGDFQSLDDAWEAHKVRNQIAHEGSNFALSQYDAKLTINRYKKVFQEFYYI